MIANKMKFHMLLLYDKMFEFGAPAYSDNQISSILSDAEVRVASRNGHLFESTEKKRRNLEQYIKSASLVGGEIIVSGGDNGQVGIHPNGKFFDLPNDFSVAIEESVKLTDITDEILVKPVKHDFYLKNRDNPYKKPSITVGSMVIWRMDFSREDHGEDGGDAMTGRTAKRSEIITEGTAIIDYRMRYLITPPGIVVDTLTPANQRHSILDETLHYEIVREAVKIATGATKPEDYQITDKEEKENEN